MKERPGFITAAGVVAGAITLVVLLAWMLLGGQGLFSPGPLNAQAAATPLGGVATHAELAADCGACHTALWSGERMADKCLACHADVKNQIETRTGLHASMAGTSAFPNCRGCHPEHHGSAAALTALDAATFPHEDTGFSLRAHRRTETGSRFACTDCHPSGYRTFDRAVCDQCHTRLDAAFMRQHRADFGTSCVPCHDGVDRFGKGFDHNRFPFKLTGKHATVACGKCHARAARLATFRNAPQECYGCHRNDDEHKGSFGTTCGSCHSTDTWQDAKFDHKRFPIDHGREERRTTCATCHPNGVKSYTCYGCHEHTPARVVREHEGRPLSKLTDCVRCHEGGRGGDD